MQFILRNKYYYYYYKKLVEENRQYLRHLTNAVLYLSKQELPLSGHEEGSNSLNKGNYWELSSYFEEVESVCATRFSAKECSKQFSGVSSAMQNDLIFAIDKVIENEIPKEIENARFI